jgi:apolipoprotein N-acyltransferase
MGLARLRALRGPLGMALLGAACVFAFAPFYLAWLLPLLLAVAIGCTRTKSPGVAMRWGFAFGLGYFGAGISWVYVSLAEFGGMPPLLAGLATLLFCAFLALFPALAWGLAQRLTAVGWQRDVLVLPAVWGLTEWLRGWVLTGFPWLVAGYSQVPDGPLAGFSAVLGVHGVSWLVFVAAGLLAQAVSANWRSRRQVVMALSLAGLVLSATLLRQQDWTTPTGGVTRVALLQGNVPQEVKWRAEAADESLQNYAELILATQAPLVVLPETALPFFYADLPPAYRDGLLALARARGGAILAGLPTGDIGGAYYNSVVGFSAAGVAFYHKHHLVPFGEYIPPLFGWIDEVLHIPLSSFSRGALPQPPFAVAGQQLAVNICYEDVFGEEIIRALPAATLLVNVTNDAWFGDSFALWQHLQIAQMRALETGRMMLRATNTGVTAIIDRKGEVLDLLPPFSRGHLEGDAQGYAGTTPYINWGNRLAVVLMLLAGVAGWGLRQRG